MPHATTHRVLFIDAYDSFTNNIIALLETNLRVQVTVIKIDQSIPDFTEFLKPFTAVVAGPGPGDPRKSKDVGWIRDLWKLERQDLLPVLGICLGFQSLVLAFGGTIDRLGEPRHGVVRKLRGVGASIFLGLEDVETVQYHSLYASVGSEGKHRETGRYDSENLPLKCSDLRPLAWDYEIDNLKKGTGEAMTLNPWRVLMAVEHKSKPFFGIQFHAESICSNGQARKVMEVWWETAKKWRRLPREYGSLTPWSCYKSPGPVRKGSRGESLLQNYQSSVNHSKRPSIPTADNINGTKHNLRLQEDLSGCNAVFRSQTQVKNCNVRVITSVLDVGEVTVPSICENLGLTGREAIILDSELHQRRDVGEHSIIGLVLPNSLRLEYRIGTNEVRRVWKGQSEITDLQRYGGSVFWYLKSFMSQYRVESSKSEIPFWGGLMGFISYEACLETIGITHSEHRRRKDSERPDLSFVFVERSIVIDHFHRRIHVQTIKPDDQAWVATTTLRLRNTRPTAPSSRIPRHLSFDAQMMPPNAASYKSKVRACQSAIRAGDSYELCLTNQAIIRTQPCLATWPLYLRLRYLNPAPFSAYVRLGKLTLLSSSPERFLQWSRPTYSLGPRTAGAFEREEKTISCQFRPIKGTVQRQPDHNLPPLTLAEATALLATPKERAENLMIVDLIRHDLHSVVGSGRVSIPKLMVVEEYATLFQLVSVVEGSLVVKDDHNEAIGNSDDSDNSPITPDTPNDQITLNERGRTKPTTGFSSAKTGLDILAASLPPGSMTGAPKLRSCQLLQSFEDGPRGIYSGVLGYLDVGGGGDFSVIIRSAVRWDPLEANGESDVPTEGPATGKREPGNEEWTIGAGGAVTSMSSEEGEWEEMVAKMKSTLRLFEGDNGCAV